MVQSTNVWLALLNRTTFAYFFAVLFIKMPCTSNVLNSVKVALHFHIILYKYQLSMRKNVPQLRLHSSLTDNQIQYYVNWLLFSTCKCQPQSVFFYTHPFFLHLSYLTVIQTLLPRVCMYSKGLSNHIVCLSKILKQLKYTVIRSEKGTIKRLSYSLKVILLIA